MTNEVSTRRVAKVLREAGLSVVTGTPRCDDMSNCWVIGDGTRAVVLNCGTHSILGMGCFSHPDYQSTRDELVLRVCSVLEAAGISYERSQTPDQIFLSGYKSQR